DHDEPVPGVLRQPVLLDPDAARREDVDAVRLVRVDVVRDDALDDRGPRRVVNENSGGGYGLLRPRADLADAHPGDGGPGGVTERDAVEAEIAHRPVHDPDVC